jgi:hypothetical protein
MKVSQMGEALQMLYGDDWRKLETRQGILVEQLLSEQLIYPDSSTSTDWFLYKGITGPSPVPEKYEHFVRSVAEVLLYKGCIDEANMVQSLIGDTPTRTTSLPAESFHVSIKDIRPNSNSPD